MGKNGKVYIHTIRQILIFAFLLIFAASVTGCEKGEPAGSGHREAVEEKIVNDAKEALTAKLPIEGFEGDFNKAAGWLDESSILFYSDSGKNTGIYKYNLASGKKSLLLTSDFPVVNAIISPSGRYILIHSAPSTYEGMLTVIDQEGKQHYQEKVSSYELSLEWSPYNEEKVLVSTFDESWNYQTSILNIKERKIQTVKLPQPFAWWLNKDEILYLDWDKENPALTAPLLKMSYLGSGQKEIAPAVYHVDTSKKWVLSISDEKSEPGMAAYHLYNKKMKKVSGINVPQLSTFSGWLVPSYAFIDNDDTFLYFSPVESGEADLYNKGFILKEYSMKTKKQSNVLKDVPNEPLSCSPSGDYCLYGHNFEKLINLREKTVTTLMKSQ
ncbi:TolB family protein [Mesobacillus zeae]|uniref:YqgU-like 6-bladed beta-propeller domain-containing protein n=1 Tax=Mesobacillus zeae TaxID=1917180 RepID=A0A398B1Y2_9BACI|nr:hypothetical protein [Mesobacillus zeae]RID83857.1 hypothetical protein D1970_14730 [Mesobacillus zeae]